MSLDKKESSDDIIVGIAQHMKEYRASVSGDLREGTKAMSLMAESLNNASEAQKQASVVQKETTKQNAQQLQIFLETLTETNARHDRNFEKVTAKLDEVLDETRQFHSKIILFEEQRNNLTKCLTDMKTDQKELMINYVNQKTDIAEIKIRTAERWKSLGIAWTAVIALGLIVFKEFIE